MNVNKLAARDAAEYARAQVFYGNGAGTRRNLIEYTVRGNMDRYPGYAEAFDKALDAQDWASHTAAAVRERRRLDLGKTLKRNTRGVLNRNVRQMTTVVAVGFVTWGILKELELDEPIKQEAKRRYQKAKAWTQMQVKMAKARAQEAQLKVVD